MSRGRDGTSLRDLRIQLRRLDGEIFGPYTRREVLSFIYSKKVDGSESILFEGTDRWKAINSDNEFFDAFQEVLFGLKPDAVKSRPQSPLRSISEKTRNREDKTLKSDFDSAEIVAKSKNRGASSEPVKGFDLKKQETSAPKNSQKAKAKKKDRSSGSVPQKGLSPSKTTVPPMALQSPGSDFAHYKEPTFSHAHNGVSGLKNKSLFKKSPMVLVLAFGLLALALWALSVKDRSSNAGKGLSALSSSSAPSYFRPLLLRISAIYPIKIPEVPEQLESIAEFHLPHGFGAHVFADEIKHFMSLAPEQRLTSGPWMRFVWSLKWLGEILKTYDSNEGERLTSMAEATFAKIAQRSRLSPDFIRLFEQIEAISRGELASAYDEIALGTDEASQAIAAEVLWMRYWRSEIKAEEWIAEYGEVEFQSAILEASLQVKKLFFQKSADTVLWLDQLATEDPESFLLWFVAAEYFWRVQSTYLQKSYLFWVSGLGAVSLYPRSFQMVYLEQMTTLIKLFGRQEPAAHLANNAAFVAKGDVSANLKIWKPIFGSSIDTDQLTDEILESGAAQRLSPIRLASLQNLAFTVSRRGGRKLLQVGYYWLFERNYKRALETFENATNFDDAKAEAWGAKVWLHAERFQFNEALEALDKVRTLARRPDQAALYEAILHYFGRDYDFAREHFEKYLKVDPGSGLGHYFYGRLLETTDKNVDCAKAAYLGGSHGVGEVGFRSRLLFYRCRILGGLQISSALADLEKIFQNDPSNTAAIVEYIHGLANAQLNDKAIQVGRNAVEKFPRSYELRLALGDVYVKDQKFDTALAFYNHARKFRPEAPEAFIKVADLLFDQERYEMAADNYQVAARLNSEYPELWLKAAQSFRKAGKKDDALMAYNRELEFRPSVLQTFLDLAEYLLELSSPQAVVDLFKKYEDSFNDDPRVSLRLAQAYLGLQNYTKARERASFAQHKLADHPEPYRILGMIADFEGNYPAAKRYFQQYLTLLPQAPDLEMIRTKLSRPPYTHN